MWQNREIHAAWGSIAVMLATLAWFGDRRRTHRADLDRVGLMHWTSLFFWALLASVALLALAVREWLAG